MTTALVIRGHPLIDYCAIRVDGRVLRFGTTRSNAPALARDADHHFLTSDEGDLLMAAKGGSAQSTRTPHDRPNPRALDTTENSAK